MEHLVSVVIPSYNRKDTILDCVNSCLNQTYNNIEVIIVDDASTDNTSDLFSSVSDPRIHFYRYEENKGACFARNYGIERAKGDIIALQDSDDIWLPSKIEKQIELMKANNADLVFCGMNRIDPIHSRSFYYPIFDFDEKADAVEQLLSINCISTQTILIKRSSLGDIRFDTSFKRYQDWDFVLQAAINGLKICYLKEPLVESTVQPNSISAKMKAFEAYQHLYQKYEAQYEKYPSAEASIFMQMAESVRLSDRTQAKKYYSRSLKDRFNFKILVKYVLYSLRLWK